MKNIKNNIKLFAAAAAVGALVTGCDMELTPLNEVVLENYWTNKEDVQSVVNSCYYGLQENGYVKNLIVWGEVRSDNVDEGTNTPVTLQDVLTGSLKTTNPYCNWDAQYTVINRCNTVLYYAPQVAEKDPNYTPSDLRVTIAEMKALRAFSYLTLIKTFQNVPFSLEASIDDTQDYRKPATSFEKIVDSLIIDLEPVKDYAPKKNLAANGVSANVQSTGRITRPAMYALLAELYLWKASDANRDRATQMEAYKKCIECCDWVLNFKIEQKETETFPLGSGLDYDNDFDAKVYADYGIPMLLEGGTSTFNGKASEYNFYMGNSFESLFEITYMHLNDDKYVKSRDISGLYGGTNNNGGTIAPQVKGNNVLCPQTLGGKKEYNDLNLFSTLTDYRALLAFQWVDGGVFPIKKFVYTEKSSVPKLDANTWPAEQTTNQNEELKYRSYNGDYSNWIVYRLSDVILFRAEAEIELAGLLSQVVAPSEDESGDDESASGDESSEETPGTEGGAKRRKVLASGNSFTTADELYADAFNLIRAVYDRSNPDASDKGRPQFVDYATYESMHFLLMQERRREFLFEGKRYYDLVRQARREGNTQKFSDAMMKKFGGTSAAIRVKMTMMDFMYLPYAKGQMKVNPNLVQNPAYEDEEESVKN